MNGFRFGTLAYISDIKDYPDTIFEDLDGIEVLIISALRYSVSPLHFTVAEAVDFAKKSGAAMTYLTHISHELEHVQAESCLPPNVRIAYDSLELNFSMAEEWLYDR